MSYIKVAKKHEIDEGEILAIATKVGPVAITFVEGEYYAFSDLCTHADVPFSEGGEIDGTDLICPAHGARFDIRDGHCLRRPAEEDLESFPVRLSGDDIEIDLG